MHIDAHIGTDTTVVVHVIANPKPTFTWYKVNDDGEKLIGKGSSTVTPNSAVGKLMIRDFKPKDEGTYEVVVSNGNPETNLTVTFMLTITGKSKCVYFFLNFRCQLQNDVSSCCVVNLRLITISVTGLFCNSTISDIKNYVINFKNTKH